MFNHFQTALVAILSLEFVNAILPRHSICRACKESRTGNGPITIRTPYGLGVEEWAAGLEKYAKTYQHLDGADNYDIKN